MSVVLVACDDGPDTDDAVERGIRLTPEFVTSRSPSCAMASPVAVPGPGESTELVTVALDGEIRAFDPATGEERWSARVPAPDGQTPIVLATPALTGDRLIFAWQNTITQEGLPNQGSWLRESHEVRVFDLSTKSWDAAFPSLTLQASAPAHDGGTVELQSRFQLLRSAIHHLSTDDTERGLAYVSVGNGPSIQPFHGWVFELDLDAWHDGGSEAAVSAVLLTTAENDCRADERRRDTMVCGGGVWTPAGLLVSERPDGSYELIVPTGNGRVDYDRRAYAHSLLRTGRGLPLEPGCDTGLCSPFDEFDPDPACLQSCDNLFTARMPEGQRLMPDHRLCDGLTFLECYGVLDSDLGANAPVEVQIPSGPRVFVHVGKDGGMYLVDAEHMGTLYDREQALPMCGTEDDPCRANWTGQFVTQPVVGEVDGEPLVIASGFMFDETHPAGVVAFRVTMTDGEPDLVRQWQTPDPTTPLAVRSFRRHTGRPLLHAVGGEDYVFVVEPREGGGLLWVIRASDGVVMQRQPLDNDGARYVKPLVLGDVLYVGTCEINGIGEGGIEAFRIEHDAASTPDAGIPDMDGGVADFCEPGGLTCNDAQYCEREWCGGPGLCHPRPESCSADGAPVCGCDGRTYANACEANRAGATVDPDGSC